MPCASATRSLVHDASDVDLRLVPGVVAMVESAKGSASLMASASSVSWWLRARRRWRASARSTRPGSYASYYFVLSSTIGGGMIVSVPKGGSRTIENGP